MHPRIHPSSIPTYSPALSNIQFLKNAYQGTISRKFRLALSNIQEGGDHPGYFFTLVTPDFHSLPGAAEDPPAAAAAAAAGEREVSAPDL